MAWNKYCPECGVEFLAEKEGAVCCRCDILLTLKKRVAHLEAIEAAMREGDSYAIRLTRSHSVINADYAEISIDSEMRVNMNNIFDLIRKGMK